MSIVQKAVGKYQRDGLIPLFRSTRVFVTRSPTYASLQRAVIRNREKSVTVGDVTAQYRLTNHRERMYLEGDYFEDGGEAEVIRDVLEEIASDDVYWDVGGNIAQYPSLVGQRIDSGAVFCFEPYHQSASRARENLELNDVDGEVLECVLSDQNGAVRVDPVYEMPGTLVSIADGTEGIRVPCRTGDSLVSRGEVLAPTVMKLDVDGAEKQCLQGCEAILSEECRLVYIEVHESRDVHRSDVDSILEAYGFETTELRARADSSVSYIKAEKR